MNIVFSDDNGEVITISDCGKFYEITQLYEPEKEEVSITIKKTVLSRLVKILEEEYAQRQNK